MSIEEKKEFFHYFYVIKNTKMKEINRFYDVIAYHQKNDKRLSIQIEKSNNMVSRLIANKILSSIEHLFEIAQSFDVDDKNLFNFNYAYIQ